jgi:hypothetical protein
MQEELLAERIARDLEMGWGSLGLYGMWRESQCAQIIFVM